MRYEALDSWRGVCASMVMFYHFAISSHIYMADIIRNAFLFVDFFFVLSGFVIAANYQERLMTGFGIGKFMTLRLGRVWPLHVVLLGAFVLLELAILAAPALEVAAGREAFADEMHSPWAILTNLFLIHSIPGVHEEVTWNGPSWSISVEFYTYLIFAIGFALVARLPRPKVMTVLGLVAVMLVAPLSIYIFGGRQNIFLTTGGGLIRCVYGFAAGVLASMLFLRYKDQIMDVFKDETRATLIEVAVLAVVILFVTTVGFSSYNLAAPYLFLFAVIAFAPQAGAVSKVLLMPPMLYLGALSYSIYMVHYIVQALLNMIKNSVAANSGRDLYAQLPGYEETDAAVIAAGQLWIGDAYIIATSVVVFTLSAITYHYVETPGRNFTRRLVGKWGANQPLPKPVADV